MSKIYYPQKLNKEVLNLERIFGSTSEKNQVSKKRLEYIIRRIMQCSEESELKLFCYTLSRAEIKAVAIYMKSNYLKVDLNKILEAFVLIDNFYCFQIIYELWQQDYRNPYKRDVIVRLITQYKSDIIEHYKLNDTDLLAVWMSSSDAEITICKYAARGCADIDSFEKRLEELQIKKKYSLYKDIESIFLCHCDAGVYLSLGDEELLSQIRVLSLEKQRNIIYNFLDIVDSDCFEGFEAISEYSYDRLFGDKADTLYNKTIGNQSDNIRRAYNALINVFWLTKLFGRDRRSRFWKKYIKNFTVRYFSAHDMLLMEFNRCSIIEFKQIGPIYFFDSDYFDMVYVKKCLSQRTVDLKSDMYYDSKVKFRKVHQGYWESDVAHLLNIFAL